MIVTAACQFRALQCRNVAPASSRRKPMTSFKFNLMRSAAALPITLGLAAGVVAIGTVSEPRMAISACNPCAATKAACNPCAAAKACNPCNPCAAAKASNPCAAAKTCNPCSAAKACNPCNPCAAAKTCNPCSAAKACNPCNHVQPQRHVIRATHVQQQRHATPAIHVQRPQAARLRAATYRV